MLRKVKEGTVPMSQVKAGNLVLEREKLKKAKRKKPGNLLGGLAAVGRPQCL